MTTLEADMLQIGRALRWPPSEIRAMHSHKRKRLVDVLTEQQRQLNAELESLRNKGR